MIEITVSDPWFTYIKLGKKTIEGRLNKGKFTEFKKNDLLKIKNENKYIICKIKKIKKYNTFKEYLTMEGLIRTLPKITNLKEGINEYKKFYSNQDVEYGVLAFYIQLHKS